MTRPHRRWHTGPTRGKLDVCPLQGPASHESRSLPSNRHGTCQARESTAVWLPDAAVALGAAGRGRGPAAVPNHRMPAAAELLGTSASDLFQRNRRWLVATAGRPPWTGAVARFNRWRWQARLRALRQRGRQRSGGLVAGELRSPVLAHGVESLRPSEATRLLSASAVGSIAVGAAACEALPGTGAMQGLRRPRCRAPCAPRCGAVSPAGRRERQAVICARTSLRASTVGQWPRPRRPREW